MSISVGENDKVLARLDNGKKDLPALINIASIALDVFISFRRSIITSNCRSYTTIEVYEGSHTSE